MSRARDLADLGGAADAGTVTGASLIINGDMAIAQRGTSTTNSNSFAVDRFKGNVNSIDQLVTTYSQSTTAPAGFTNSLKVNIDTAETALAADEFLRIQHFVEAQNLTHLQYGTSGAKSITLSFYVRSSLTGTYGIGIYSDDGGRNITSTYTINSADTWEYKTITFSGDTGGTINNDNGKGFQIDFYLAVGSDWKTTDSTSWGTYASGRLAYGHTANLIASTHDWYITGVKLEVGTTATPFQHETYAENLNKCHRYYVLRYPGDQTVIATAIAYGAGGAYCELDFPVEMRAVPSVTFTSTASHWEFRNRGTADRTNNGAPSGTSPSKWNCRIDMALASNTTDGAVGWIEANSADAYYAIDAEL